MPSIRPRVVGGDQANSGGRILVSATSDKDGTLIAITKWIPIEVIAFYEGVTTPFGDTGSNWLVYALVLGTVITALWIAFATNDKMKHSSVAWRQVFLASLAFIFWVVGTTSPSVLEEVLVWWQPAMNPAVLALGAVALPIADGILRRIGVRQD